MYDEDLTTLEEGIRRLKVEYEIFFNGSRKRPPDDLRMRLEKMVKRLSEASDMSYPQRFRYNTLITRFYVFRDVWRRALSERESGIPLRPEATVTQSPPTRTKEHENNEAIRVAIVNAETEGDKIRQLYEGVIHMRGKHADGAEGISYQQFARYIAGQTQDIRSKYNCTRVLFTVTLEGKTLKFTAKPEK